MYSVIESIGREKIQADVVADINSSQNYIHIIIAKCIVIQFIKDGAQLSNVPGLGFLQPNYENIWLIYVRPPRALNCTTYCLLYNDPKLHNSNNYSNIMIDINKFLRERGDNSFKFIH
jgi:hypothetical protein